MGAVMPRCPLRIALALCACMLGHAWAAEPLGYAVKAAYLSKFGFYVEWPNGAFASPASPLNLCVVGDDPFGNLLDDAAAAAAQRGEGRAIVVMRMKSIARDSACHIVYLGGDARSAALVEALRGTPALVVSDARNSNTPLGTIHFVLKDNRVRFIVDDEAAAQSGLNVSSKLLSLALSVKPRTR